MLPFFFLEKIFDKPDDHQKRHCSNANATTDATYEEDQDSHYTPTFCFSVSRIYSTTFFFDLSAL